MLLTEDGKSVPLKSVFVDVNVIDLIANVSFEQIYEKTDEENIEVVYKFPVDDCAAVYFFEATVDGVCVVGQIQETDKARKSYDDAKASGKFASIVEDEETDVFQIKLCNFKKTAKICLKYHTELKYENGQTVFFVPTTIAPRYNPKGYSFDNKITLASDYKVSLVLKCNEGVVSSTADFKKHEDGTFFVENATMDRDIIFYINTENNAKFVYQKEDDKYVGMLTYVPTLTVSDKKSNFIFFIDRSGSMHGQAMEQAKSALNTLMHAIPEDSYFNILSFGSGFETLFVKSKKYSQETLETAKKYINDMTANFGGTEIYTPLKSVLKNASHEEYMKQIFILTDGEVSNVESILNLIKQHKNNCRIFAIGLGSSACHYLVNSIARIGGGVSRFASLDEKLDEKMLSLLELAITESKPVLDVKFQFQPAQTVPRSDQAIFNGVPYIKYFIFDIEPNQIVAVDGQHIFTEKLEDGKILGRMLAKKLVQELIDSENYISETAKHEIVKLGLAYNIITKYTSFVAVGNEKMFDTLPGKSLRVCNQMAFGYGASALSVSSDNISMGMCVTDSVSFKYLGSSSPFLSDSSNNSSNSSSPLSDAYKEFVAARNENLPKTKSLESVNMPFDLINFIIEMQNFDGSFNMNDFLKTKISYDSEFSPTVFVVAYLEMNCIDSLNTWKLVVKKAKLWLAKQGLEHQINDCKRKCFNCA